MRKHTCISVIPVAAAWLVILLHAIIPHHHLEVHPKECTSVYHCCHSHHDDRGDNIEEHGIPHLSVSEPDNDDHRHFVCHFTSGPYHPLDNEIPFLPAAGTNFFNLSESGNLMPSGYIEPFTGWRDRAPNYRRGPPSLVG